MATKNSEAQRAACRRYYQRNKDLTKVFMFRFNKKDDGDVIAAIEGSANKTDYIRRLVRQDMGRE